MRNLEVEIPEETMSELRKHIPTFEQFNRAIRIAYSWGYSQGQYELVSKAEIILKERKKLQDVT